MQLDILSEDPRWDALDLDALARRAIAATLDHLHVEKDICEISLLACNDQRISELNGEFRDKSAPTNVLSWPAEDRAAARPGGTPEPVQKDHDGTLALGDIALSFETCMREARDMGVEVDAHVAHLVVHGTLHLFGYDHVRDPDATLMEGIETEILGKLGFNDPYS